VICKNRGNDCVTPRYCRDYGCAAVIAAKIDKLREERLMPKLSENKGPPKVISVNQFEVTEMHVAGLDWEHYRRSSSGEWSTLMGSSWEDCGSPELEVLYQDFMKAKFDKLMEDVPIVGSLDDENVMGKISDFITDDNANMDRNRPYNGQPWTTTGTRGSTEIKGITFRDLRDCFIRAAFQCSHHLHPHLYEQAQLGEKANLSAQDMYGWDLDKLDPIAWSQQLGIEVEKMMGIYPNVPKDS